MLIRTNAIVLRSLKYSDSQVIVDMLTEQSGRVSFICRLAKTAKGKLKKQLFQPLTILEITYDSRPRVTLQRIVDASIRQPFGSIPFHPYKLTISLFIAEFLLYSTRDEQQDLPLYQYVESSVRWLDATVRSFANFHLVFMMRLSRFIGFFPNLEDYRSGDFFDLRNGTFSTLPPLHPDYLNPQESAKIGLLMRMNYESMHLFAMTRAERNRCTELILDYYRLHVPGFPELKSLPVLRELFD